MTEGIKKWSTAGRDVKVFLPVPPGKRKLKLITNGCDVQKDKNNNPYIKGLRLLDVTDGESIDSPSLLLSLFLSTTPYKEGGKASVEFGGAILDLVKNGLQTEVEFDQTPDGKALDPDSVLEFLENNDGSIVTAQIVNKAQKGSTDGEKFPQVRQFLAE